MSHIGLGISMNGDDRVICGVERRVDELHRAGASNDGSAGGTVQLDGRVMFS